MTTTELERPRIQLTTSRVAASLGITPAHLRKAELRGEIPPARRDFGTGDRYYDETELPRLAVHFRLPRG